MKFIFKNSRVQDLFFEKFLHTKISMMRKILEIIFAISLVLALGLISYFVAYIAALIELVIVFLNLITNMT